METWRHISVLALDVDGVLTDGTIYYGPEGDVLKGFSARDGMGISLARAAGLKVVFLTGRKSPMVERRAADLHIDYLVQAAGDKYGALAKILVKERLSFNDVAYMGDDLNDLSLLSGVAFSGAPADACAEARAAAQLVSTRTGGHGALREFVEYILKKQAQWDAVLERYRSGFSPLRQ